MTPFTPQLAVTLLAARGGDDEATTLVTSFRLGIAPADIEASLRLSVTLDDFATLASAQAELKHAG